MRWPILLFLPLATIFAFTDLDLWIAHVLFFDPVRSDWVGANSWVAGPFLHTGGRWVIRGIMVASIGIWAASFASQRLRPLRRAAGYFALASVLSVAIVGLLKTLTNVDCPWDLLPFGGRFPAVPLFGDRPDALRTARCFPAAHASSGYALLALYYVFRERGRSLARLALAIGLLCGVVFGVAQQSRGAHFVSHDLWSAFLVWLTVTTVYVAGFRMTLLVPEAQDADAHA